MVADPKVVEKIQKLLALATSPNEHEAAAAAAKAQALLLEHQLEMEQVVGMTVDARVSGVTETERETLREQGKPGGWKVKLFQVVGKTSGCMVIAEDYRGWKGEGRLIGRHDDVQMAQFVFNFLVTELTRLQDEYGKERWTELRDFAKGRGITTHEAESIFSARGTHPLRSKQSWIKGAVDSVVANLEAAAREREHASAGAMALVVHKDAAIKDFLAQKRGFKDAADERAQQEAASAKRKADLEQWAKDHPDAVSANKPKAETASQRRRREQADANWWRRQQEKQYRQYAREAASTDWSAYERGRETGKAIKVGKAVSRGTEVRGIE